MAKIWQIHAFESVENDVVVSVVDILFPYFELVLLLIEIRFDLRSAKVDNDVCEIMIIYGVVLFFSKVSLISILWLKWR